jgi:hypothetical protein
VALKRHLLPRLFAMLCHGNPAYLLPPSKAPVFPSAPPSPTTCHLTQSIPTPAHTTPSTPPQPSTCTTPAPPLALALAALPLPVALALAPPLALLPLCGCPSAVLSFALMLSPCGSKDAVTPVPFLHAEGSVVSEVGEVNVMSAHCRHQSQQAYRREGEKSGLGIGNEGESGNAQHKAHHPPRHR